MDPADELRAMVTGFRPRSASQPEQQYAALFDDAGLRLSRTLDTTSRYSIVDARSARTQGA
jgi:hypothetical protein